MLNPPPDVDERDFEVLLEEAKQLAPFYVPEWDVTADKDSGVALLKIFFHMLGEVTSRLNEVPEKNFIAFLDMLGVKQVPAQPADVPLAFQLATGAPDTPIPGLTQAEASNALIFETAQNILGTTAALTDVYSVVPTNDEIFNYSQNLTDGEDFELFVDQNQQEHALYLGHADLFNITGEAKVQLTISPFPTQLLDQQLVSWQYYGEKVQIKDGEEVRSPGWYNFDSAKSVQNGNPITLVKSGGVTKEIIPFEINGIETRWIRCLLGVSVTMADYVPAGTSRFQVDSLFQVNGVPGIGAGDQLEITPRDSTDESEKAELVTVASVAGRTVNIQGKLQYAHGKGALVKRVRDVSGDWAALGNLQIDTIALSTSPQAAGGIDADLLFNNDVPLEPSKPPFYPFGKQPRLFDTFYIASQEAFSKKGAEITLNMQISRKETGIPVKRVQGIGDEFDSDLEKGLLFGADLKSQNDLDNGNMPEDLRQTFADNKFPFSEDLTISIEEGGSRWLITDESDNQTYTVRKEVGEEGEQLNIYIEPIRTVEQLRGYTSAQLSVILNTNETRADNILEAARKEFYDKTPPPETTADDDTAETTDDDEVDEELTLSWEYWNEDGWTVIEGLEDGTSNLTIDGIVTFTCPEDIVPTPVVGQENS
ncbi:MAG: hypothetical protein O7E52_23820, partial [Candidatus Poribacteria bacterium]|nr:hypothetical protein [Candidatus Poribacteria bacterium]